MSTLDIDVAALRAVAGAIRTLAGEVPQGQTIDLANSGSARVAAAAGEFAMWAMVSGALLSGKITKLADDADLAATTYEITEAQIAAESGG